MKKLNNRITLITNLCLLAVLVAVFSVSFLPQPALPIYGGKELKAIYHGNKEKPYISIMFNVYENTQVVNGILDVLEEKGVKATFFVGGCWADDNEKTLCRIVNSGNQIANHGYFHKDHKNLSYEQNKKEITLTEQVVNVLCGAKLNLFAPPSGSFSFTTLQVATDLGYKVIMWSKDTIDWRDKDENVIFERATKNLTNGDLVLMHPKNHTLSVLPKILDYYLSCGFSVVTVGENVS